MSELLECSFVLSIFAGLLLFAELELVVAQGSFSCEQKDEMN
jgi:hypothetical protein